VSQKFEILYQGAHPALKYRFNPGERIKAVSNSMITMSPSMQLEARLEGGCLSGLARLFLTQSSFFFQHLTAGETGGEAILGPTLNGGLAAVRMDGHTDLLGKKRSYLASTQDISVCTKFQGLIRGLFSREGFFLFRFSGKGLVFLASSGAIHYVNLAPGQEIVVDNGHLVAWSADMGYKVQKASRSFLSSIFSGEALVCRFTGPGHLFIQTRRGVR
jgi:uncharacterized protein (TIGR00266 family)